MSLNPFSTAPMIPSSCVNSAFKHCLPRLSSASLTKTALGAALGVGVLASGSAQASLVVNGGFENGLSNWTCTISTDANCLTGTYNLGTAPEGLAYFSGFDNNSLGILSQALQTVAGTTYNISFLFNSDVNEPINALSVQIGNLSYTLDLIAETWTTYSGTFTAASSSTPLNFLFNTVPGSGVLGLDNVVVNQKDSAVAVPGPLPLFGAGAAFGWSRRLRKRIATPLSTPLQA